jgi:hypothetical protein
MNDELHIQMMDEISSTWMNFILFLNEKKW